MGEVKSDDGIHRKAFPRCGPSDSPLTDAAITATTAGGHVPAYLARKLERQRNRLVRIARDYIEYLDDSGDEAKAKDYRRWLNQIIEENAHVDAQIPASRYPESITD